MEGMFIGALLLLTTGWTNSQSFDCPKDPNNPNLCPEELYPYPDDCEYYWACYQTCIDYFMMCPAELHFEPHMQTCLDPSLSTCVATTTVGTTTTITQTTIAPNTTLISTTTTQPPITTTTDMPITSTTAQPPINTTTGEFTTTTESTTTSATTTAPTTTDPERSDPTIFFAGKTSTMTGNNRPIFYENEELDRHNDFDGSYFVAPSNGLYFFNLNAGYTSNRQTIYRMQGSPDEIAIRRMSYSHNGEDTGSRDYIFSLDRGDVIFMQQSLGSGEMYASAEGMETSFSGFSLHNTMYQLQLSAFSVGRTSGSSALGAVAFNKITTNRGNDWSEVTHTYTAPYDGFYYFSMSTGVEQYMVVEIDLTVNGNTEATLIKDYGSNVGEDTFSRALVIYLQENDEVQYNLKNGIIFANARLQISFAGFHIQSNSAPVYAWSLHKTSSWDGSSTLSPVDYEEVLVNEGRLYSNVTHILTITLDGYYYVHLGAGVVTGQPTLLKLYLNNGSTELMTLIRTATNHGGIDTISRSGIFYLRVGDELKVESPSGNQFHGEPSTQRLTNFQGFLIYPETL